LFFADDTCKADLTSHPKVTKPTLIYFNVAGRAEVSRLILAEAGVDYHFDSFPGSEWASKKATLGSLLPFHQVPFYLEPSGFGIPQSGAIERYLSRKHGLAGGDQEMAYVDAIVEGVNDVLNHYRTATRHPIESEKEEKKSQFFSEILPIWLKRFEVLIENKEYFVGNRVSYADLSFFSFVHNQLGGVGSVGEYPGLLALVKRVQERPNIKKYLENRNYPK